MLTRREFLRRAGLLSAAGLAGCVSGGLRSAGAGGRWAMPAEGARHRRTWMAFGASREIWGARLLPEVRRNIAVLAAAVARHEPVSMLVRPEELDLARAMAGSSVDLIAVPLDDIWIRDTGPVFVLDGRGGKAAVDFNFNGWGRKQACRRDAGVAARVAAHAGAKVLRASLVLEGGGIEVDGEGTALLTESCVVNDNRNPGWSRAAIEESLMSCLGLGRIIWLPGIRGADITDGHTDFYARFAGPGVVLAHLDPDPASFDHEVTQRHMEILRAAKDARGRPLRVMGVQGPASVRPAFRTQDFAAGYLGFYLCNDAVLMQEFGDPAADLAARHAVEEAFPGRAVEQLAMDGLAAGGGTMHCVTQQEPWA
mgnify:CR=1 FL=1